MLHPAEQRCTLLSYAAPCEIWYTLAELSTVLIPFLKFRNAGLSGTGIWVPHSGTRILQYRTQLLDAGVPMPLVSASMLIPSYGIY
jgi:hypothetical protein